MCANTGLPGATCIVDRTEEAEAMWRGKVQTPYSKMAHVTSSWRSRFKQMWSALRVRWSKSVGRFGFVRTRFAVCVSGVWALSKEGFWKLPTLLDFASHGTSVARSIKIVACSPWSWIAMKCKLSAIAQNGPRLPATGLINPNAATLSAYWYRRLFFYSSPIAHYKLLRRTVRAILIASYTVLFEPCLHLWKMYAVSLLLPMCQICSSPRNSVSLSCVLVSRCLPRSFGSSGTLRCGSWTLWVFALLVIVIDEYFQALRCMSFSNQCHEARLRTATHSLWLCTGGSAIGVDSVYDYERGRPVDVG